MIQREQPDKVKMTLKKEQANGGWRQWMVLAQNWLSTCHWSVVYVGIVSSMIRKMKGFMVGERAISSIPHLDAARVPANFSAMC